ncbi:MAG TPA: archease [Pirellulales bacterium]|nr:archease [Pirellulales bacterium]
MYETFEHTADLGLRVRAADLDGLFAEAGRGLFSLIVANMDDVRTVEEVSLGVVGAEMDYLLFDWLNELLFIFETRRLLLVEFRVRVAESSVQATARGEPFDPARHHAEHEVKAITYHELNVSQETDGTWLAELIVDI